MKEILITKDNAGGRLDKLLGKYLDRAPKSFVYKMLRKKNIELNDKKAAGNEILKEGDRICLYLAEDTIAKFRSTDDGDESKDMRKDPALETELLAEIESCTGTSYKNFREAAGPLVLYEDEKIIAFHKPAGMLSQRAKFTDLSLNEVLVCYLKDDSASDIPFTPGISNRLDRNTSGIVLAGKTAAAVRQLNQAIKDRRIRKQYLCLVKGQIKSGKTLDGYLVKDESSNSVTVFKETEIKPSGKKAERIITIYRPRTILSDATLLEVDLITGKSHQIRAHLSSVGHPIIGDPKYGDRKVNAAYRKEYAVQRQLLHAWQIVFQEMEDDLDYLNGKEITAPLPADFLRISGITES